MLPSKFSMCIARHVLFFCLEYILPSYIRKSNALFKNLSGDATACSPVIPRFLPYRKQWPDL